MLATNTRTRCPPHPQIREKLSGAGDSSDDLQFDFSDFEIREAKKVSGANYAMRYFEAKLKLVAVPR